MATRNKKSEDILLMVTNRMPRQISSDIITVNKMFNSFHNNSNKE